MEIPAAIRPVKTLVQEVMADDVLNQAAALAYRFLFALFPFAIFLAALVTAVAGFAGIDDPTGRIIGAIGDNLPPDVAQQIAPQLDAVLGQSRPGLLSLGAILALWSATSGVSAVIAAMNRAYDIEDTRGFLGRTLRAAGLTLLASGGIILGFATIVGSSTLTQSAAVALGVDAAGWQVITALRWPVVLAMVAFAVAVLFRFGPNVAVSFRWALIGGSLFAIGWIIATAVFGIYVANFANYANTYGALGGVVVLMLWFYITAVLLLVAAEVTSLLARTGEPDRLEARQRELATDSEPGDIRERAPREAAGVAPTGPLPERALTADPAATYADRPGTDAAPTTTGRPDRPSSRLALAVLIAGWIAGIVAGLAARRAGRAS